MSYVHRQSMRRQKSQLDMEYTHRVEQRLLDQSDEQRALDERQRKQKVELDNLLKGCRDKQDDFERHLGNGTPFYIF